MRSMMRLVLAALLCWPMLASAHDYEAGGLMIEHPWTRATPPGASTAGAFLVLRNEGASDDRLMAMASPLAERVELHQMRMRDGVMKMRPVEGPLVIPAGGAVELKPGGYHLMLIGLTEGLRKGAKVPLTLTFEKAGDVAVELVVQAMGAPMPGPRN